MSKIDNLCIKQIKFLSLDMINNAKSGKAPLVLSMADLFYNLFLNHLNYDRLNPNYLNRDYVITNNDFLPLLYSTLHLFGYNITIDNLKEYKKLNSVTNGFAIKNNWGIDFSSITYGDCIASAVGISLANRYSNALINEIRPKTNLINNYVYCICTMADLMSGIAYESLSFAASQKLNKLIIIANNDGVGKDSSTKITYTENLIDRFMALDFNIIDVKNGHNQGVINDSIEEAKASKKPTLIILNTKYGKDSLNEGNNNQYNKPLSNNDIFHLVDLYKLDFPILDTKETIEEIKNITDKRLNKSQIKYQELYNECLKNPRIKEIIDFLETKEVKIDFYKENFKMADSYNEELIVGNSKIFNAYANKSPFVLTLSNDNFITTMMNIKKEDIMSKDNLTARNILLGNRTLAMGFIANALSQQGYITFVSAPLNDSLLLNQAMVMSAMYNYPVHYVYTNASVIDSMDELNIPLVNAMDNLHNISNLITFRPCCINEIIGIYDLLAKYRGPSSIVVGSDKRMILSSDPKYVVAGAYCIKKERLKLDGILISRGTEVKRALEIAEELVEQNIDLRVVSMVSMELFNRQSKTYQNALLKEGVPVFVIETGGANSYLRYTKEPYIMSINNYNTSGTKEELLHQFNLTKDEIKKNIIKLLKS